MTKLQTNPLISKASRQGCFRGKITVDVVKMGGNGVIFETNLTRQILNLFIDVKMSDK